MSEDKQYAVVRTGGKQYRISAGQRIRVEKLSGELGDEITLEEVLAIGGNGSDIILGSPIISGAKVKAKIVAVDKDPKVTIFKKKRRKGYTKTQGHRQQKVELLIEGISQ